MFVFACGIRNADQPSISQYFNTDNDDDGDEDEEDQFLEIKETNVINNKESIEPCFVLDPLGVTLKKDIVGRCGYLARVITEGLLTTGETIEIQKSD